MIVSEPLRTERLILRPLAESDLDDVVRYQSRADVLEYMLWPVRTREESLEHIRVRSTWTSLEHDGDALVLAVEHEGRVVGEVNLRLHSVSSGQVEIGWILHPDAQGRGLAKEAAERLLRLAFEQVGAHRVVANLDAANAASAALCERLGMRREAYFREDLFVKGRWCDTYVYALLASEWPA